MPPKRVKYPSAWITPAWVPRPPDDEPCYKRKRDGWLPFLDAHVSSFYRKRRRLTVDLRRTGFKEHTVQEPLGADWEGFPGQLAESIKASYAGRSYHRAPEYQCRHCGAAFWWEERVKAASSVSLRRVDYNLCCKGGKVFIPPFKKPPPFLADLLHFNGDRRARRFITKIRQYNCLFSFTSMGARIDCSINDTRGPNIFKIQGAVSHRMGSLLPEKSDAPGSVGGRTKPKFAELYIYDTTNEASPGCITDQLVFYGSGRHMKALLATITSSQQLGPTSSRQASYMLLPCEPSLQRKKIIKITPICTGFCVPLLKLTVLHTVEFQKRGLPHAHILIWLKRSADTEMPISPLSKVNPGSRDWAVQVYVSRRWHHRGGTDDGPIKHTDLVLLDKEGNHMYGEILHV